MKKTFDEICADILKETTGIPVPTTSPQPTTTNPGTPPTYQKTPTPNNPPQQNAPQQQPATDVAKFLQQIEQMAQNNEEFRKQLLQLANPQNAANKPI